MRHAGRACLVGEQPVRKAERVEADERQRDVGPADQGVAECVKSDGEHVFAKLRSAPRRSASRVARAGGGVARRCAGQLQRRVRGRARRRSISDRAAWSTCGDRPAAMADDAIALLRRARSVTNVVAPPRRGGRPAGRRHPRATSRDEDASVDHRRPARAGDPDGRHDRHRARRRERCPTRAQAAERHARGVPADAVVWENVADRTLTEGRIGWGLLALFVLAGVIAADRDPARQRVRSIVGAMAVVARLRADRDVRGRRRPRRAPRSRARASWRRWPASRSAVAAAFAGRRRPQADRRGARRLRARGQRAGERRSRRPTGTRSSSPSAPASPGCCRVTLARSAALVGVAISITTIPAAADIGALAGLRRLGLGRAARLAQLAVNIAGAARRDDADAAPSSAACYAPTASAHGATAAASIAEPSVARPSSPATTRRRSSCARASTTSVVNSLVAGVAAEVRRAHAGGARLEHGLVDRARGALGAAWPPAIAGVVQDGGAGQDHRHRVGHVLALRAPARCRAAPRPSRPASRSSLVEGQQHRLGAGDRAEHRHHEVAQAVAVAVERGDDERHVGRRRRSGPRRSRRSGPARRGRRDGARRRRPAPP